MPKNSRKIKKTKQNRLKFLSSPIFKIGLAIIVLGILLTASGFTFAATQEQHDSFCASCHTQPESTFYERSTTSQPVDLASVHTPKKTRCIDCHSGIGLRGRLEAELLGAHNALAFYTGTAVQPAKLTRQVGDASCLKCHAEAVAQQATQNNHFHVFLSRWQQVDASAARCVGCHQGHNNKGSADLLFLERATTQQVCESCHLALGAGD
jgi:hypothetical protein